MEIQALLSIYMCMYICVYRESNNNAYMFQIVGLLEKTRGGKEKNEGSE
jgi:hypothetical protein